MINEVVYCPRLFALEHLDGEWAESADTKRGARVHKRVDRPDPRPDAEAPAVRRSLHLSDPDLGIVARCDLVELDGETAVPVDYKKGQVPEHGPWLPERVQLCAQALLLRAHGYQVERGVLYFAGSKRRVDVPIDAALVDATRSAIALAQRILETSDGSLPPPLVESPKCPRCSLVGICLPDETNLLQGATDQVRPIAPSRADGVALYVEARGAKVSLKGGEILVSVRGEPAERVRISDTSSVVIRGAASITTPVVQRLTERGIPVSLQTFSGWWYGHVQPVGGHNVHGRIAQFRVASTASLALPIARAMVVGKIRNSRVLLRRNGQGPQALRDMKLHAEGARQAMDVSQLMGHEGNAARTYFSAFPTMLRHTVFAELFDANGRNRRPPLDPVNALLSYAYSNLVRVCAEALQRVGLDPMVGVLHSVRPGRPALALDLMEEFRSVIAESCVLRAVNTGVVGEDDFLVRRTGVSLTDRGRRAFIRVLEQRWCEEAVHPVFERRMAYRRIVEVQARMLSKAFRGEVPYVPVSIR
jgi:CRISPR-associated endonuclease Cas1/CRISPR-associated protein Cas4